MHWHQQKAGTIPNSLFHYTPNKARYLETAGHQEILLLTNLTSVGETSSLDNITLGGWFEEGSFCVGLDTPLMDATCELESDDL